MRELSYTTLAAPPTAAADSLLDRPIVRLLLVIGLVAGVHGFSVTGGLWLDDHLHFKQLREAPWTYQGIIDASRLDLLGQDRVRFWGHQDWSLRFYRPVAFALMKVEYTLVGWHPAPMHVLSLLWNVAVAMLAGSLTARLLADRSAGTVAALLFAIFPNNGPTLSWIACQTELMVAFFCLVAALSYGRWSGWFAGQGGTAKPAGLPREISRVSMSQAATIEPAGQSGKTSDVPVYLALGLAAYMAAMGCRENAVALSAVLVAGDLLSGRLGRRRIMAWVLLACAAVLYMILRHAALGGMSWPQRPYFTYPGDPGFWQFVGRKFLYYLSGLFASLPVLPGGTSQYAEKSFAFEIGTAVTVLLTILGVWLSRRRMALLGLIWPVIILIPLLPLFPSPHHLYLSAVGPIILWTAVLLGVGRWIAGRWPLLRAGQPYTAAAGMAILLVPMAGLSFINDWVYVFSTATEDQVVAEVLRDESVRSGDELLFINLPINAPWITAAIETGAQGRLTHLKAAVLTVADEPTMMSRPSWVVPIDRHRLRLQVDPPGWLYGGVGELFAQTSGVDWPPRQGQQVDGPIFDVTIEELDVMTRSATSLRFDFHEPIDKPGWHVYFGSPSHMAYPLHFEWNDPPTVTGPE